MPTPPTLLANAVEQICRAAPAGWAEASEPLMAVVLGSGLGGLADQIEPATAISFDKIAGLARPTAPGHRGEFLIGWYAGVRIIAMAGRLHAYEGHSLTALTRPMSAMAGLQPLAVIVSCAAGGLNPRFQTGDLVIIDEHLSLLHGKPGEVPLPTAPPVSDFSASSPDYFGAARLMTCYEPFAQLAVQTGGHFGFRVHRGTYLAVTGPNYETRAECRMMKSWGMDVIGMSTVPEVVLSSQAGLRTLAIAVVTNMAVPDAPQTASHNDVLAVSSEAAEKLERIVAVIARSLLSVEKGVTV